MTPPKPLPLFSGTLSPFPSSSLSLSIYRLRSSMEKGKKSWPDWWGRIMTALFFFASDGRLAPLSWKLQAIIASFPFQLIFSEVYFLLILPMIYLLCLHDLRSWPLDFIFFCIWITILVAAPSDFWIEVSVFLFLYNLPSSDCIQFLSFSINYNNR